MLYRFTMRKLLLVVVALFPILSLAGPDITSMDGLRGALLSEIITTESFRCAYELIPDDSREAIPFKVVVGVRTDGDVIPTARRNRGSQVIRGLASWWSSSEPVGRITQQISLPLNRQFPDGLLLDDPAIHTLFKDLKAREIPVASDGKSITLEAGINIYLPKLSGEFPVREHLILVETFPHEGVAGALIAELVKELQLNPRQDLLVIHNDIDLKATANAEVYRTHRDNGNLGTRSIAYALGMPNPDWRLGDERIAFQYPFAILRQGCGRPTEKGPAALREYLDDEAGSTDHNAAQKTFSQISRWLIAGYYERAPQAPSIPDRENGTDPRYQYSGVRGTSPVGWR